ncbi:hypothetical protein GCM10009804_36600 [Kribbella hippodromi]|uniref:DUF4262 domain-containing protein n=1 Tax=Kribbella hippodromi TaxID=434347 RepID=A0ABN2DGN4_9ACTN
MRDEVDYHEVEPVVVWLDGEEQRCSLDETATTGSYWTLVLTVPDGRVWTGAGQGLWTAFVDVRRQIEALGYRMCCAGARADAFMRQGKSFDGYVVDLWTRRSFFGIRHQAELFDYAPASKVTTVDEQLARYGRWIETPWWRAFVPGDPVRRG